NDDEEQGTRDARTSAPPLRRRPCSSILHGSSLLRGSQAPARSLSGHSAKPPSGQPHCARQKRGHLRTPYVNAMRNRRSTRTAACSMRSKPASFTSPGTEGYVRSTTVPAAACRRCAVDEDACRPVPATAEDGHAE